MTLTWTSSPTLSTSSVLLTWSQESSEMWSRPSMPGTICRNAPYFLVLVTTPSTMEPAGSEATTCSQGSCCSCRSESEMRLWSASSLMTLTDTSSPTWSTSETLETRSQ